MNLYEISKEYEEILVDLYDDEGEINQTALQKLEQNDMALEQKAIAIASFIENMNAQREAIEKARKAMAEREKQLKKRMDDLEGYLLHNMERRGINLISCSYFDIKLKKCPVSVEISDETLLPGEYTRIKTEVLPDKLKIKDEMMQGVIIPGAALKQNLRLEIR